MLKYLGPTNCFKPVEFSLERYFREVLFAAILKRGKMIFLDAIKCDIIFKIFALNIDFRFTLERDPQSMF